MILVLLQAICLWMTANAQGWDLDGSLCSQQPSDVYTDRNEIWSRCHANANGGGPFTLHRPMLDSLKDDEMEVVTTIQVQHRTGGHHEITQICLTFTDGVSQCTAGAPDHYEHVGCQDLNLPASHRIHELIIWTNGRHEEVAITSLRIKWSDPEGAGGIQVWDCGRQNYNAYPSEPVQANPGKYQLAGFYGKNGWWMDQLGAYLYDPPCNIIGREIIDIQCTNAIGERRRTSDGHQHQSCAGVWDPTDAQAVDVNAICENCDSDAESLVCAASFSVSKTHEIKVEDSHSDSVGGELSIGASFEFDIKLLGFGGGLSTETSVSVNYEHSWTHSTSQTDSSTTSVASTCTQSAAGGTVSTLGANVMVGFMTADFIVTYRITKQCGDDEEVQFNAQATISNVASTEVIQQCKQTVEECTGEEPPVLCQLKINDAWRAKHNFETQSGFPLVMFAEDGGYPYYDIITGTWPNLSTKQDFQKYFKCLGTYSFECDGLQFPNYCHTPGLCNECFVIEDETCVWDATTGGVCNGDKFGIPMEINAAKAACLLDQHCTRIECDNAGQWDTACMMCSADLTTSTAPDVTTTVYSPQSDCGNASRSLPGAPATDPPTKAYTGLIDPPSEVEPKVCSDQVGWKDCKPEGKANCKWLAKTDKCYDLNKCDTLPWKLCKLSTTCLYIKGSCLARPTCSAFESKADCKANYPLCGRHQNKCKNREFIPCSAYNKKKCTKFNKRFNLSCVWDGSSCA